MFIYFLLNFINMSIFIWFQQLYIQLHSQYTQGMHLFNRSYHFSQIGQKA